MISSVDESANANERVAPNTEVGDRAPTLVRTAHELDEHRVAVQEEHHPTRPELMLRNALGRQCNAVRSHHWFDNMSAEGVAALFLSLQFEGTWPEAEAMRGVFGDDLMCGYPSEDDCVVASESTSVVQNFIGELAAPVRLLLERNFSPIDLAPMAGAYFDEVFTFSCVTTGRLIIHNQLLHMEHALHSYGYIPSRNVLKAACRILTSKVVLGMCVAFGVPVAEAASTAAYDWAEFSSWIARVWHYKVLYAAAKHMEFKEYLAKSAVCMMVPRPMTISEIEQGCRSGALPQYYCDYMDFERTTEYWKESLGAYMVPREVCGDMLTYGVRFWATYIVSIVVAAILLMLSGFCLVRSLSMLFRVIRGTLSIFSAISSTLQSRIKFRSSVAAVKQAVKEMDGVASAGVKPLYRMIGVAPNSFDSLEMSMNGSEIRTSSVIPGCVHLAVVYDGQVTFAGMAFRYKDYLVTAQHNIFAMTSTPGKYYIIPFKPCRRDESSELDMDSMLELTEEMIGRDIVSGVFVGFDATVIPVKAVEWSRMGVKSLEHADAIWNTHVTAYGLEKSGKRKLQRSLGTIIKGEEAALTDVFYSASTLKGWSGSPILSGQKKVVALHCGTTGEHNRGLNFAYIRFFIDVHETMLVESNTPIEKAYLKSFRGKNGRLARRREELELEYLEDEAHTRFAHAVKVNQASNGMVWMSHDDEVIASAPSAFFSKRELLYEDECALPITQQKPCEIEEKSVPVPASPRRSGLFSFAENAPFAVEKTHQCLGAPYFKGRPVDYAAHVDLEEAEALGYDPTAFSMPLAVDRETAIERSKKSLSLNLQQTVDVRSNYEPPNSELRANAKMILMDMLKPLRYEVDGLGVTADKIRDQLNSSAVSGSKSPGLPFVLEGHTSNADLMSKMSIDELIERVMSSYKDGTWCENSINFLKIEPTKKSKLEAGMDRTVQGVGLATQLVMRCFFGGIMDAATDGCRKSPIMAGWSPLKPGDGEFLWGALERKKHKLLEYDGQNFEYVAHTEEAYADVTSVMIGLALPAAGTSSERLNVWRREAAKVMELTGKSGYHCADGTVIKKLVPIALNSGRFDTYIRNSITGAYWTVIGLLECGCSRDEILKMLLKFGGDDFIGAVPVDFEHEKLIDAMRKYGMKIHKVSVSDYSDGFEFFSWHFKKTQTGVTWVPSRFSKHVENYLSTKHEHRPDALVAHMMNWVHSEKHFDFWRKIYQRSRRSSPEDFCLSKLPMRESLIMHLRGHESLIVDEGETEEFAVKALAVSSSW